MASNALSNLNIRLGFLFDKKSLRRVERSLQQSGQKLSALGSAMTVSISAPLALLGGAAIKTAGEFEQLSLAMEVMFTNAGRSTAEAAAEVEALRKAAQAPGLAFEQAVQGSIRLQSVGVSAEKARSTIVELANAVASTGGTAQNLDSVTVQLSQIISKGRVLTQDLRIIKENMPIISKLMEQAFGTSNAEAIQKLGISGVEFTDRITAEMKKLNRVEGGITNSIVNAGIAIKVFLASIGTEINRAFNIKDIGESFANTLNEMAASFAALDDSTKRWIVQVGLAFVALGPLVKVFGVMKLAGAQLVGAYGGIAAGLKVVRTVVLQNIAAFNALNLATRAFVVIGIVTALASLAYNMGAFSKELTTAAKVQKELNSVQREAAGAIAREKSEVDLLIKTINSEVTSREGKERALKKLQAISPKHFGQLKVEKGLITGLTDQYDLYVSALLKSAKAAAARERIIEIERELLDLEDQRVEKIEEYEFAAGLAGQTREKALKAESKSYNDQVAVLTAKRDALANLVITTEAVNEESEETVKGGKKEGDVTTELTGKYKLLKEVLSDIANERSRQDLLGASDIEAEAKAIEGGLKRLLDGGFTPTSAAVVKLAKELKKLFGGTKIKPFDVLPKTRAPKGIQIPEEDAIPKSVSSGREIEAPKAPKAVKVPKVAKETFDQVIESIRGMDAATAASFAKTEKGIKAMGKLWKTAFKNVAVEAINGVGQILSNSLDNRKSSELAALDEKGARELEAAKGNSDLQASIQERLDKKRAEIEKKAGKRKKQLALAEAAVNIAVAITKAASSLPFPFNLPAIVQASAIGAIQLGVIASQKFARGTEFASGGLSLVGEQGPELVSLPRGSQVMSNANMGRLGSGQSVNVSGTFRVAGTDLELVLERTQEQSKRIRGY
jgi:tape measure domain-containing protein